MRSDSLEYTLRQFQLCELEMLKEVSKRLQAENITFYIIGGSSIGALRHQGFIPWDDDIDIAIMRRDFDKAEKTLADLGDKMFYDAVESHKIPDAPLGHVYMLDGDSIEDAPRIDVFAIDNIPDNALSEKIQKLCALIYHVCVLRRPCKRELLCISSPKHSALYGSSGPALSLSAK